jgi:hypothetical protein
MADANDKARALDKQITVVMNTHKNVAGLVDKLAKVEAALIEAGLDANKVSPSFKSLSASAEEIGALLHRMEEDRRAMIE